MTAATPQEPVSQLSLRAVRVDLNRNGSWDVTLPVQLDPVTCGSIDEARRVAYRLAAGWRPCEVVMCDAYHRVVHRQLIDSHDDAAAALRSLPPSRSQAVLVTGDRTATHRAPAASPALGINSRDRQRFRVLQGAPLVGITTKPLPVVKTRMTPQQRDAIKAFGQLAITIEQAFPRGVADTPTSQQSSPGRGPADGQRLVYARSMSLLRNVVDSTAKSLSRDGEKPQSAPRKLIDPHNSRPHRSA